MKKFLILLAIPAALLFSQCYRNMDKNKKESFIPAKSIDSVTTALIKIHGEAHKDRITKGVAQAASLWIKTDGNPQEFKMFCEQNFVSDSSQLQELFERFLTNYEVIFGNYNRVSLDLKRPLHIDKGEMIAVDEIFGAYDPFAHVNDDFFANKLAFVSVLNFPFYSLEDKNKNAAKWNRKQWAYARLGDMYTARIPASLLQKYSDEATAADTYISGYNIYMGNLLNKGKGDLFPADKILISHWGLRDELKSNYNAPDGPEKQEIIYQVMLRIINQEIPDSAINNPGVKWDPYTNKVTRDNKEIKTAPEADVRYAHLLSLFRALRDIDPYCPLYPTFIQRKFEQEMEIPQPEVEKLFTDYLSSPQVKKVAALISKRLNRKLRPYDIWYDGFKSRSSIPQEELDSRVKSKYPNLDAFVKNLPEILVKLQFPKDKAEYITAKIAVDPSRGAGHAWGSMMKGDRSHLRTRFPESGMNYKGYNIAIHEFGHNVEQTLSLYDVDYYVLSGVPNTAFTEALAFIFQKRDLELLGIANADPNKEYLQTLDNFWASYEIMGVSLVDMRVWKWLYENPNASPKELKQAVIKIATDVWNTYYADVFGVKDSPILAIYSHMIDNPLYLSAYPIGHLIDFQIEEFIRGKNFGDEVTRIYTLGKLTPDAWMKSAVGQGLSIRPILNATDAALEKVK